MMHYKSYLGQVEYDDEAGLFHGEVVNIRDVVTFQGSSVKELQRAFRESVDDYVEFCKSRNETPEKPFSGTFTVRIAPPLHRAVYARARIAKKSLNGWVADLLTAATNGETITMAEARSKMS